MNNGALFILLMTKIACSPKRLASLASMMTNDVHAYFHTRCSPAASEGDGKDLRAPSSVSLAEALATCKSWPRACSHSNAAKSLV